MLMDFRVKSVQICLLYGFCVGTEKAIVKCEREIPFITAEVAKQYREIGPANAKTTAY